MKIDMEIKTFPVCPECKGALVERSGALFCAPCNEKYPVVDGIPLLISHSMGAFKDKERRYHSSVSVDFDDAHNLDCGRVAAFKSDYHDFLKSLPPRGAVLELGCGTGWDARIIAGRGNNVCLGDISTEMVKKARDRIRAAGISGGSAEFFVFDAEAVPFPRESFDAALITAALHHLPSPAKCLSEMARVLKPGGIAVLGFEPNSWPYYTLFPARRLLSIFCKAVGVFLRSPSTAFRKLREVKRSDGVFIEIGNGGGLHSTGDRATRGFTRKDILRLLRSAGLEPVSISRIWYLNGFIQEFGVFKNLRSPAPSVERILIAADRAMSKIPILRTTNWHWNILALKPRK